MRQFTAHSDQINSLAYTPAGDFLISAGSDANAIVWDLSDLSVEDLPFHELPYEGGVISCVDVSPDGELVAAASWDGSVSVWSLEKKKLKKTFDSPQDQHTMISVSFSMDGSLLAMAGGDFYDDNPILIYDTKKWNLKHRLEHHESQIGVVTFAGDILFSGSADNRVRLWTLNDTEWYDEIKHRSWVQAIAVTPDGKRLATTGGNQVWLYELTINPESQLLEPEKVATIKGHKKTVMAMSYAPDGSLLATSSKDGSIRFWDGVTGEFRNRIDPGIGELHSICFAPDGLTIATGGEFGTLAIVDVG